MSSIRRPDCESSAVVLGRLDLEIQGHRSKDSSLESKRGECYTPRQRLGIVMNRLGAGLGDVAFMAKRCAADYRQCRPVRLNQFSPESTAVVERNVRSC